MTTSSPSIRCRVALWSRAGCAASMALLAHATLSLAGVGGGQVQAAPVLAGNATISGTDARALASGLSDTPFLLDLPGSAGCTGDSATNGYRAQTFMVPASIDPATLTFDADGPTGPGTGAAFRQPLFDSAGGSPVVQRTVAAVTGQVDDSVVFSLAALTAAGTVEARSVLPAGDYTLGYMCTVGAELDRFWTARLTIVHNDAEARAGISFTVAAPDTGTTTTTAPTSTVPGTSTTTVTTVAGGGGATSTTVARGATTTSTVAATGVTTSQPTAVAGAGGGTTTNPSGRALPRTGFSTWWIVMWAALTLILGRVALLAGRTPKVLPPQRR